MPDEILENDPLEPSSRRRESADETGTEPDVDSDDDALPEQNGAPSPGLSALDPRLARLTETARGYARAARSENTARAYDADWRKFASWLRRNGFDDLPPDPQTVGLYLAAQAEAGVSVATLERRLSGICWRYRQLGAPLEASEIGRASCRERVSLNV